MKPRAKKKARAMSQGIGSPKAEKAAAKVSVLVRTEAPRPSKATAPRGKGWVMMPTMVARKIARSCHAFLVTPAGVGTNQRITPVAMDASKGFMAAPCHGSLAAGVIEEPPVVAAALTERPRRGEEKSRVKFASLGEEMRVLLKPRPRAAVLREFRRVWETENGFRSSAFGKEAWDLREWRVGERVVVRASDAIFGKGLGSAAAGAQRRRSMCRKWRRLRREGYLCKSRGVMWAVGFKSDGVDWCWNITLFFQNGALEMSSGVAGS